LAHTANHEHHFVKMFIGVLIALSLLTAFIVILARMLSPAVDTDADQLLRAETLKRIEPVGVVNTSEDQIAPLVAVAAAVSAPLSTDDLVAQSCAACHASGAAGAPKLDDADEWAKRREAGLDALVASVINGKGAMPARAGTQYSDEELRLAVVAIAGFADAAAVSEVSATVDSGGDADASLTPRIKGVVDTVCAACHQAGIAGAIKTGDAAAWTLRAEKGLPAMVAVVARGQGAMPPRGGSDLSDEELTAAITYLMSK